MITGEWEKSEIDDCESWVDIEIEKESDPGIYNVILCLTANILLKSQICLYMRQSHLMQTNLPFGLNLYMSFVASFCRDFRTLLKTMNCNKQI